MHELHTHETSQYVIFIYDNEHLLDNVSFSVQDWQQFYARFRKAKGLVRFYQCGEYGLDFQNGNPERPHYYVILFGLDLADKKPSRLNRHGDQLYESATLNDIWGNGFAQVGDVTFESARYVASYVNKKLTGELADQYGVRKPPFATMSRCSGIGAKFFEKYIDDLFNTDHCIVDGRKLPVPKYYDKLLEASDPERWAHIQQQRFEALDRRGQEHLNTREVRDRREAFHKRSFERFKREGINYDDRTDDDR